MPVVSDYTAILAINDNQYARWNGVTDIGAPVIVTYSFADGGNVPTVGESSYSVTGTSAFTQAQRENFRDVTAVFEAAAGVIFVEVEEGGMIDASNAHGSAWGGWASYASSGENFTGSGIFVVDSSGNYDEGTYAFETLLHELGHSMGLQHPHDGSVTLDPSIDNDAHTVMTYNGGSNVSVLGSLDKQALSHLYGNSFDTSDWVFSFNETKQVMTVKGDASGNTILGVAGENILKGLGGRDRIYGREHDDTLAGGNGADKLYGGNGDDVLAGGGGNDRLVGGYGEDKLSGGKGEDVLKGGSSDDRLYGGADNDILHGGDLDDRLRGEDGKDKLFGNYGNDILNGGNGADVLNGGNGYDILNGGSGKDILKGGAYSDIFVFKINYGKDEIRDFEDDIDSIKLDQNLWSGSLTKQQVVDQFASVVSGDIVFDFGNFELTLTGFTDLSELTDDLIFI